MRVWRDGKLQKAALAATADDRGLTLGDGVFETLLVKDGIALWRFEHVERMRAAAAVLGIPFPEEAVENAIDGITHRMAGTHALRLTLTRGAGGRGLAGPATTPTLIATLSPFDAGLQFQPLSLKTVGIRRNLFSPASSLKVLSYVDNVLAAREAADAGFDDALMLNTAGRVACSSIGNVFMEVDGVVATPSLSEGILPGIMRGAVIAAARQAGIKVREKQIRPADLAKADMVFVTNSLRYVRVVKRLDGRRFTARSSLLEAIIRGVLNAEQDQIILN